MMIQMTSLKSIPQLEVPKGILLFAQTRDYTEAFIW